MSRTYEKPTIEKEDSPVSDTVERHPAYAQIGASRVSGQAYLYGSDFAHRHYMTISIHRSELHRGLSNDWPFSQEQYIEVALSEAQWATFVSSPNNGSGVQCTLERRNGVGIPGLPSAPQRKEQFQAETNERLAEAIKGLDAVKKQIEDSSLSQKAKKEILSSLSSTRSGFTNSIDFIEDQFGEHMEQVVEHAKIEVNAYVQQTLLRAGQEALAGSRPILMLEPADEEKS